ncbi:PepSY-associated TM helix domain-containing protein [Dyadobacter fermentans]|uniref:PepSY-associated TM helix domain-containing protein n=1 Tax=Dyadobacter fermentans TaxID=94254 RepID=UPI001CBC5C8C|nr:PepSY-associated TM helix domain-containing protein [Dyadobacter fermentans]MBZ1358574.1 PepSY domain-containing protein [Dyadobacter fermentans]
MKKTFKKIASQLHLWLGVSSGLVVFIVALTGSVLVFEEELEPVIYPDFHVVEVPKGQSLLPIDNLRATVANAYPKQRIARIEVEPHADRTIIFGLVKGKKEKNVLSVAVNPYTAEITDTRRENESFFHIVLQLHRYLCLKDTGKAITGVATIMFVVIMITGLVLWWPNRKQASQRFIIKWNAKFKRLNWDLHAVFGFYVLPFTFLIALTGLVWSYKWVNSMIFLTFDGKPQQKREAPANVGITYTTGTLAKIITETHRLLPHPGRIQFTLPESDSLSITVSKVNGNASISNVVDFLYFDQTDGKLISKRLYDDETTGMKVRRLVFPIHTGSIWGWPTKVLALLVALITATLPVTGVVIWVGRKFKKKEKVVRKNAAPHTAGHAKAAVG